jgi:NhaP-type Na+/H+ or K+/H+ antiporter
MLASIAGAALFAHFVFGFGWASAFLLGAILAPTDPVWQARFRSTTRASRPDALRAFGEAGFNDGAAFPFVVSR